jgi:hypothetical protein
MSNYENIEYIIKKRQDNINNKKMWYDGLTDEEYKICNRYYIKKLRENPEKKEAERKYSSEKITCECGCVVVRAYICKHKKTTRHSEMLEDKKLLSKEQLEKLNEILEAQKKAKEERQQHNLNEQFKRMDMKRLEQLNTNK